MRGPREIDGPTLTRQTRAMDSSTPVTSDTKMWAMFCHLSALSGCIIPFGNLIGPLIIWQIKKAEIPLVDDQGKESLNFQITVAIAFIAGIVLAIVTLGILIPLLWVIGVADIVFIVIAALKANKGEVYRYPYTLRLVK